MESKRQVQISKKLSYFLRHHLDAVPGPVDPAGYVEISSLLQMPDFISIKVTQEEILQVVETSDKKRFGLDSSKRKIRANQGHSIESGKLIDTTQLLTKITVPQDYCVHGTTRQAIKLIKETGLKSMDRTHIHFASKPNAISGFRSDSTVLVHVDMAAAMADGIEFFISENDVILSPGPIDPKYFKSINYVV
jgi:RNA:NAD 2'-phosphotransferase (TPT1/KptA family)